MGNVVPTVREYRFGPFALDARTGELTSAAGRTPLREQPHQLLLARLDRPGDLVTREEFTSNVQASTLARHAQALRPGARVGVLVHAQDNATANAMQLARLSVAATVSAVDKESATYEPAAALFAGRFPAAEATLAFADFSLYALTLGSGRFVGGFARAVDVTSDTFAEIFRL